jgi:hypothetical protein
MMKAHEIRARQLIKAARERLYKAMLAQEKTVHGIARDTNLPKMNVHRVMHGNSPLALHTVAIVAAHLGISLDSLRLIQSPLAAGHETGGPHPKAKRAKRPLVSKVRRKKPGPKRKRRKAVA